MADTIATNLSGKKIKETYKGVLHFDTGLGSEKKPVYDGAGTKTALQVGTATDGIIIDGDLQVLNELTVSSDSYLTGNLNIGGDISLINGGSVNDLIINPTDDDISLRALKNIEVGKLRIRESSTDYELIFGNPTQTVSNLFSIIVKKDNTNNLYIKNNYGDPDNSAPLWINRATGEVNIKSLKVGAFDIVVNTDYTGGGTGGTGGSSSGSGGGLFPTGGIMMFPVAGVPTGWLECNGDDISINDYGILYKVIGHNYTTLGALDRNSRFQIPDMRALFVRGWDHNKGVDTTGGVSRSLGTTQEDLLKDHTHSYLQTIQGTDTTSGGDTHYINAANGTTGSVAGGLGGSETRPKNIALVYCIKT